MRICRQIMYESSGPIAERPHRIAAFMQAAGNKTSPCGTFLGVGNPHTDKSRIQQPELSADQRLLCVGDGSGTMQPALNSILHRHMYLACGVKRGSGLCMRVSTTLQQDIHNIMPGMAILDPTEFLFAQVTT